ncbi:MAG TPA: PilZ domain-containing protein [Terriglobia bacterium]|nr:PilZ domain-containing protein [Terriglobia bacterium]
MLPADHAVDRRRWERVTVEMAIMLFASAERPGLLATALDLSWNGVRIRGGGLTLRPGDAVDVVLMGDKDWDRRAARVVWVENAGAEQALEAGLEFQPATRLA